jgi:hypothetical protein
MEYDAGADSLVHTLNERPLLYPNPVNGMLSIKYLCDVTSKLEVDIFTAIGKRLIHQSNIETPPGMQQLNVNVDQLPCGIYFYTIQDSNHFFSGKFLKF